MASAIVYFHYLNINGLLGTVEVGNVKLLLFYFYRVGKFNAVSILFKSKVICSFVSQAWYHPFSTMYAEICSCISRASTKWRVSISLISGVPASVTAMA